MDEAYQVVQQLRHPKQFSTRLHDHYALEPWEKNTLQADQPPKAYKTFYQGTSQPIPKTVFPTQRVLSLSRQQQFTRKSQIIERRQLSEKKGIGDVPQKAVAHYNITGNFLNEPPPTRNFNNQFFLRNKQKKGRSRAERLRDIDSPLSSFAQMKKRFSFQRQSTQQQSIQFVRFNSEKEQQKQKISTCPTSSKQKRKGKLISLGFRKISAIRSLVKHKSMNLEAFAF